MNKQKLILPVTVILSVIILGSFIYTRQLNKQKSIERQQQIDIQSKETQWLLDSQIKETEAKMKIEAEHKIEADRLTEKYRGECLLMDKKNSKVFQTTYDNCDSEYCKESIEKLAFQNSGINFINPCIENKLNGTFGGSGLIKKAEKWTGEIFLNGERIADYNEFLDFFSKQDCLEWGNKQKLLNSSNSYKCGRNCGIVTYQNEDSYFICDEEIDI